MPRLILASSSPRRRELIASLGIPFEVIKPDIDETRHADESPLQYVRRLSIEKAQAVAEMRDDGAAILAADTVVVLTDDAATLDGEILGKPPDADAARATLHRLRNRSHVVCTAFTLLNRHADEIETLTQDARTVVHMRDYSDAEIDSYVASGDPFDKAGGYAIQHGGFRPVARIDGDYDNVVGLPLNAVRDALRRAGVLA